MHFCRQSHLRKRKLLCWWYLHVWCNVTLWLGNFAMTLRTHVHISDIPKPTVVSSLTVSSWNATQIQGWVISLQLDRTLPDYISDWWLCRPIFSFSGECQDVLKSHHRNSQWKRFIFHFPFHSESRHPLKAFCQASHTLNGLLLYIRKMEIEERAIMRSGSNKKIFFPFSLLWTTLLVKVYRYRHATQKWVEKKSRFKSLGSSRIFNESSFLVISMINMNAFNFFFVFMGKTSGKPHLSLRFSFRKVCEFDNLKL